MLTFIDDYNNFGHVYFLLKKMKLWIQVYFHQNSKIIEQVSQVPKV
jgi:uncharacterized protein YutD